MLDYLTIARPRCIWWHTPLNASDARSGARARRMGAVAGTPDFAIAWGGGSAFIELKRPASREGGKRKPGGRMSATQMVFAERCRELEIPFLVATSIDDVDAFLRGLGLIGRLASA